jgi:putative ABC transport system substrate-binding protein
VSLNQSRSNRYNALFRARGEEMRRRKFITLLGCAAVAWPIAVNAQNRAMPVIGFLHVGVAKSFEGVVTAFRAGLKEAGYIEHQNVEIEFRWAEGHYDRLPVLAAELVRDQVAVIISGGGEPPAFAARTATRTIPIVFNVGRDPVKMGLVSSLSRPGGNITGVNILTSELATKRVGLLHDLLPGTSVFAYIVNPNFPDRLLGLNTVVLKASNETDIDAAFASIREKKLKGLLVGDDPFFNSRRDQFVALAARQAIPAIYEQREFALAGGLMSYGTSLTDSYRQMGKYAGRILKGEKPADLPVVQSAKFELVINLKAAKSLGLIVPFGLLNAADEVIE